MSDNPNTSTAVGANVNPTENKFTDWLSHVLADLGKNGIFIALIAVVALFTILTERHPAAPAEHLQPRRAERLHPRSGDRHGHGHHRGPHRPVGRLGRGVRRRLLRRVRRQAGAARGGSRCVLSLAHRRARRRLAGILGRLRRHPGVHRDARGHAHLPRARARRARQREHRLVPDGVPRARQRVHLRRLRRDRSRSVHARRSARSRSSRSSSSSCAPAADARSTARRSSRSPGSSSSSCSVAVVIGCFAWALASLQGHPGHADHPRACSCWSTAS